MKDYFKKYWHILLIALLGLVVSLPLLRSGYFSHQDDLQVIRLVEMRKCFNDFQIPCRWVPDMGWGNGFPLFNFYGVFTYYLGGIISFIVGFMNASKILFMTALIAGSFGIYFLIKEIWGKYPALTSAILYMFAPYKALDVYVRGALSESMALAIIPFVFYFGYKTIVLDENKNNYLYFTLVLSAFLITHNIMTIVFLPVLLLWIFYWLYQNKFSKLKLILISLVFAFGLSSFFVLPAFLEKDLVQTESLTRFELDYRANFVGIKKIFLDRTWGYGTSIPGPEGGMSFQIGFPYWILAGLALIFSLVIPNIKSSMRVLVISTFGVFLLSIFMIHNKSTFIWETFSILQFFQFPWRFLSLSILTASVLGGFVVYIVNEKIRLYFCLLIIVLTVVLNWTYFKPRELYSVTEKEKITGELWDQQRRGAILDYLPKTALEPREGAPTEPQVVSGQAIISNFVNRSNRWEFKANVTAKSQVEVPVYYFPNWEVKVNGKKYPFTHDNILGRISINLDQGEYNVTGNFRNTTIRNVANVLTLISIAGLFIFNKKRKK